VKSGKPLTEMCPFSPLLGKVFLTFLVAPHSHLLYDLHPTSPISLPVFKVLIPSVDVTFQGGELLQQQIVHRLLYGTEL
jgi:hypothetical protein